MMNDELTDTVAAVCTAPGAAGIAIVRLSGADAPRIAAGLCHGARISPVDMPAGTFRRVLLRDPADGSLIDEAVVLRFRAPHSYSGEDTVEFQTHGGRVPAQRVMRALVAAGARPAEPGEFTRRAFLNGRIDLSRAEAVMDLIGARSERAGRIAAEQLNGALGRKLDAVYDALMDVCADIEASLDFADHETNDILLPARIPERLTDISDTLAAVMHTRNEGHLLREGALVVLNGAPNAGKSTLFNALLGVLRAIVTDIPGTTRDAIEETMLLDGIPLRIVDTAGIRQTDSRVEQIGVEKALQLARDADIILRVIDPTASLAPQLADPTPPEKTIFVLNKTDLISDKKECEQICEHVRATFLSPPIIISAHTGDGLAALKTLMAQKLSTEIGDTGGQNVAVSERHHALLADALAATARALDIYTRDAEDGAVYAARFLRDAAESLAAITGRVYSDDLLDNVFAKFCIGK